MGGVWEILFTNLKKGVKREKSASPLGGVAPVEALRQLNASPDPKSVKQLGRVLENERDFQLHERIVTAFLQILRKKKARHLWAQVLHTLIFKAAPFWTRGEKNG